MKELLEAGVHFGHQMRRWNPKMAKYIFAERNGIYIVDLQKTLRLLGVAYEFVRQTVQNGGKVLFVGTKKQSQQAVEQEALRCQMFYVNQRWLGGTLTNYDTISKSIDRLKKLETDDANGILDNFVKKEALKLRRQMQKLNTNLSGIKEMGGLPDAVVITDTNKEEIAVLEAKKLGIKVNLTKKKCEIYGNGINGFNFKKNIVLNAGNSGTLGRLILPLLIRSPEKIKLVGDKSLSKRDFTRIINPLQKFGAEFFPNKRKKIPFYIKGSNFIRPINYIENKGSAQCKSAVMFAALNTQGETVIKAKKSRDHSELLFKYLKLPIKVIKRKKYDIIKVKGKHKIPALNYKIPSDISSAAFFIVLTALVKNSSLKIRNVNINPSRMGVFYILKLMGVKISKINVKKYKGEKIADLIIKSTNKIKSINCPINLNSSAIDEFLLIFLVAAKAKGISYFKNLSELNQKESPRLKWGSKILNKIGLFPQLQH